MDSYDSHFVEGYCRGCSRTFGTSITQSESHSQSDCSSEAISRSTSWAGTPSRSHAGDPATIARCIFRDEVRDALVVLKNVGALGCAAEREWCISELQRLLLELFAADVA